MKKTRMLWLLVAILVLIRVAYYFAQPDMSTDHLSQMAMAQNFMDGNGFSFKYLNAEGEIYYSTHIQWPPLYPLILAVITFITADTLISSFLIQVIVLVLLVIVWKKIFHIIELLISAKAYFLFISFLIISTSILNNINTIFVFSLLLLSLSLYYLFVYLFDDQSRKANLFGSSFFAALLFWTHYSYFFVAFYPAIVLFIIFYLSRKKELLYCSLSSFAISLVVASGVFIYNYLSAGAINYMDNPDNWIAGFFPEHILLFNPFVVNAFFNTRYLPPDLFFFEKNYHSILTILLQIASFVMFIILMVIALRLRKNKSLSLDKTFLLFIPFFVIIVLIIALLLYFSLHYYEIPTPGWTHIADARYLTGVNLSIIMILLLTLYVKVDHLNKKIINITEIALISLILISLSLNIRVIFSEWGKYSFKENNDNLKYDWSENLQELRNIIKFESSRGNIPIFINNNLSVRSFRLSQWAGATGINLSDVQKIKNVPSKNMVFFFILPEVENYRNVDYQLLNWSRNFKLDKIGKVNSLIALFKASQYEL